MGIDRYSLLGAPYVSPAVKAGDTLTDERLGMVRTGGYTNAPIPWPRLLKTGKHAPILCGDLVRAVRSESAIAVAHHWGVGVTTVWAWRKALGVAQINEGTLRLYREYVSRKLPDDTAALGREHAAAPEVRARTSAAKRGKKIHPATAAALRRAASRRKSKSHRVAIGLANQLFWLRQLPPIDNRLVRAVVEYRKSAPSPSRGVRWHSCEDALLGLGPDRVIAGILGRTRMSVSFRRQRLSIPAFREGKMAIGIQAKIAKPGSALSDQELADIFGIEIA